MSTLQFLPGGRRQGGPLPTRCLLETDSQPKILVKDTAVALILEEQSSKNTDPSWEMKGESMTFIRIMTKRAMPHIIRIVLLM